VILTAALEIMKRGLPHPPLTFLWTVQEEVGPYGARFCRLSALGDPKLAFSWDSSKPGRMLLGATGARRMEIEIHGVASHAGCAPEQGVSAAIVFGLAVADLRQNGWHGLVMKNGVRGTSNIGVVGGGNATNVVMDRLNVQAEARAHNPKLRARIVAAYCRAFERAARSVKNSQGEHARVRFVAPAKYESFRLRKCEPCVLEAERAIRAAGFTPSAGISTAGLDANWMTARGVPTVTIGAGMKSAHTIEECLEVRDYLAACQVALHLATASCEERNR
jgi:tripeptide aminopeptidase